MGGEILSLIGPPVSRCPTAAATRDPDVQFWAHALGGAWADLSAEARSKMPPVARSVLRLWEQWKAELAERRSTEWESLTPEQRLAAYMRATTIGGGHVV